MARGCCLCESQGVSAPQSSMPSLHRKRRRREAYVKNGQSWTASVAVAALLFLPSCSNNQSGFTIAVAAAEEFHTDDAYDNMDDQTEPWLDAEGDVQELTEPDLPLTPKEDSLDETFRTMEEELMLHAKNQYNSPERLEKENTINQKEQKEYQQFMDWCHQVMGVQSSVEIHTFYYYDYMTAIMTYPEPDEADDDDDDDNFQIESPADEMDKPNTDWQDPPMVPVRGLRATRNITEGEVIISIPFQALLTVSTTIDQDPVLSRVMGKEARKSHGWTLGQDRDGLNPENMDSVDFFELPLLAMALLHHYKLGTSSPLYPYIHMLRKAPLDSMPFLWSKEKRKQQYGKAKGRASVTKGIQTVARSIRLEMKDMYRTVVDTLVKEHPDLFGRRNGHAQEYDTLDDEDWAFSYENFQWAFAMVNSRHWLLPIVDLDSPPPAESPPSATPMLMQPQGSVDGVPPAEMPTDAWLDHEDEGDSGKSPPQIQNTNNNNNNNGKPPAYHSFLAPVADLLNFGPPCTRGRYNQESHTFDIIASCDFTPGQEITFWYSDECEEVIIGNYGFTHPMVPRCLTADDYKLKSEKWKQRALSLQEALEDAYEDMDVMDTELQFVQQVLTDCDCCDTSRRSRNTSHRQGSDIPTTQQNHRQAAPSQIRGGRGTMTTRSSGTRSSRSGDSSRGSANNNNSPGGQSRGDQRGQANRSNRARTDDDVERHGVRRMWASRSL